MIPNFFTDEKKQKDSEDEKSNKGLDRLTNLPKKIFHRSYRVLSLKIEYVQEKSIELLVYPFFMVCVLSFFPIHNTVHIYEKYKCNIKIITNLKGLL